MNRTETSPGERMRTSNAPLDFDTDQRLNLVHEFRSLSTDLQENMFVSPDKEKLALKGITLHGPDEDDPSTMGLESVRSHDSQLSAAITLTGNREHPVQQRMYLHRPSIDVWEEWRPGSTEPIRMMGNLMIVRTLDPLLPDGTFDDFADTNPTGAEVVSLLATRLRKKARSRTELVQYSAHNVEVGGPEYSRDTDFIVRAANDRVTRSLFVAASFMLADYGFARKTYSYETVDIGGNLHSANGALHISSTSDVPKSRLDAFAKRDQIRNEPSLGFTIGISDIRKKYVP